MKPHGVTKTKHGKIDMLSSSKLYQQQITIQQSDRHKLLGIELSMILFTAMNGSCMDVRVGW